MTTKELYLKEMRLSRQNNPAIWDCVAQFGHVPKDLKNTCVVKHELKNPKFTVMGTGESAVLLCYENGQVYLNRGSGWFWFGHCDGLPSRYQIAAARAV